MYHFYAAAVVAANAAVAAASYDRVHIDMMQRDPTILGARSVVDRFLHDYDANLAKYITRSTGSHPSSASKRTSSNVPLTFDNQASKGVAPYILNIGINSQTFPVAIDGGSGNLWIPGPKCGTCNSGPVYNEKGTPLRKEMHLSYGPGTINGSQWTDSVTLGGLTAENTSFTVADSMSGFEDVSAVGLLGLSIGNAEGHVPTIIDNLISAKKISNPEYSVFFSRETKGSQLTLGGDDPKLYSGSFVDVPLTKKSFWQTNLDGIYLNEAAVNSTSGQTVFDTGSSYMYVPTDVLSRLADQIPGAGIIPKSNGVFMSIPCDFNGTIALGLGGKRLAFDNRDLVGPEQVNAKEMMKRLGVYDDIIERSSDQQCVATIVGADNFISDEIKYLVGFSFVRNWYATFSYAGAGSIRFAAAKGNQQRL